MRRLCVNGPLRGREVEAGDAGFGLAQQVSAEPLRFRVTRYRLSDDMWTSEGSSAPPHE